MLRHDVREGGQRQTGRLVRQESPLSIQAGLTKLSNGSG